MGFLSFKIAPGVRVKASKKGLRMSAGPRLFRVHGGAGRSGVSSSLGPLTLYGGMPRGKHRSSRSNGRSGYGAHGGTSVRRVGPTEAQLRRQAKALTEQQAANEAYAQIQAAVAAHREVFLAASPPVAPDPAAVDPATIHDHFKRLAFDGLARTDRAARKAARTAAAAQADAYLAAAHEDAASTRARWQAELDIQWRELCGGAPAVVLATVAEALADNGAVATPVGLDGSAISIVMVAPDESDMPPLRPDQRPDGSWRTRRATAAERNDLYLDIISSHVLATIKEVFAVAPSVQSATVAVVRDDSPLGAPDWKVLCVVGTDRLRADQIDGRLAQSPRAVLAAVADIEIRFRANSSRILPLNPRQSGAAASVVEILDRTDESPADDNAETTPAPAAADGGGPQPGWHPDPWDPTQWRWWDGEAWSGATSSP